MMFLLSRRPGAGDTSPRSVGRLEEHPIRVDIAGESSETDAVVARASSVSRSRPPRRQDRLKRKPDSVWRDGPRHLCLSLGDDERTVCAPETLLRKCTEVEDLNFFLPAYQPRRFLAPLDGMMNLKRLHIQLERLFDGALSRIDLSRPDFANLTHSLTSSTTASSRTPHISLTTPTLRPPSLIHIAMCQWSSIPQHLVLSILSSPTLRIFVSLRPDTRRLTVQTMYERELTGVTDVRFVIMPLVIWIREWEDAARGLKESFWAGAERFVEGKRRGEIDLDKCWTDDDMTG
ncbi:hypothetical protein C8F01DRAFT_1370418 [Mycena amicta]|nr:hypothetical protein C8F01DRAFT_1370418 [Mycena amicta]